MDLPFWSNADEFAFQTYLVCPCAVRMGFVGRLAPDASFLLSRQAWLRMLPGKTTVDLGLPVISGACQNLCCEGTGGFLERKDAASGLQQSQCACRGHTCILIPGHGDSMQSPLVSS